MARTEKIRLELTFEQFIKIIKSLSDYERIILRKTLEKEWSKRLALVLKELRKSTNGMSSVLVEANIKSAIQEVRKDSA